MTAKWDRLAGLLSETLELYRTLLALSGKKREILVAGRAGELEAVTRQEEYLIVQAGKLDNLREEITRDIAVSLGESSGRMSLVRLREAAPPPFAARIAAVEKDFGAVTADLTALNRTNTELIQQALVFINYSISVITRADTPATYAPGGEQKNVQGRSLFDRKA